MANPPSFPLLTQLRVHRWHFVVPAWLSAWLLSHVLSSVKVSLPLVLAPVRMPDFLVILTVVISTYPLHDWLFGFRLMLVRERALSLVRVVASFVFACLPAFVDMGADATLSLALTLWSGTVVAVVVVGTSSWFLPTLGGLAVFIAGGTSTSSVFGQYFASPIALLVGAVAGLLASTVYLVWGPKASTDANA